MKRLWGYIKWCCTPHPEMFEQQPYFIAGTMIATTISGPIQAAATKTDSPDPH